MPLALQVGDPLVALGDLVKEFAEIANEIHVGTIELGSVLLDDQELERLFRSLIVRQGRHLGLLPFLWPAKGYASKSDDVTALSQGRLILKIRGSSSADKTCGAVSFSIASSLATGAIGDDCVELRRQRRR